MPCPPLCANGVVIGKRRHQHWPWHDRGPRMSPQPRQPSVRFLPFPMRGKNDAVGIPEKQPAVPPQQCALRHAVVGQAPWVETCMRHRLETGLITPSPGGRPCGIPAKHRANDEQIGIS
jgi:hypothetical protein